LKILT